MQHILRKGVTSGLIVLCGLASSAQARSSQWWYVAQGADRVLFVDEKSIERDGDAVRYTSSQILREASNDVATQRAYMRTNCAARTQQWMLVMRYGLDDQPFDPAITSREEDTPIEAGTLGEAELNFVCADDRATTSGFPLEIDDVAFAEALIAQERPANDAGDLHAQMKADPATPVIRSPAPSPATFGTDQHVAKGMPIVPPRDYAKGIEPPAAPDYDVDETGRIYDIAYQGIEKGDVLFEIRGFSIGDLVHPGSGHLIRIPVGSKGDQINDLFVTIIDAQPDGLGYRVVRQKKADDFGSPGSVE
jgi:hypothetical protein